MSLPEVMLWQQLRARPGGLKFRRQHPVAGYVIDFYCPTAKLAIEVDGEAHNRGDRPKRDAERTSELERRGLSLLRLPAVEILADPGAAADRVVAAASPLHQPAAGPPPHALHGEDQE